MTLREIIPIRICQFCANVAMSASTVCEECDEREVEVCDFCDSEIYQSRLDGLDMCPECGCVETHTHSKLLKELA